MEMKCKRFKMDGKGRQGCRVSFDGSWANRGFKSLWGQQLLIHSPSKKVVGIHISGRWCPTCEQPRGSNDEVAEH
eukprot:9373880-Prorocentrum_lima.AAC.1